MPNVAQWLIVCYMRLEALLLINNKTRSEVSLYQKGSGEVLAYFFSALELNNSNDYNRKMHPSLVLPAVFGIA